MDRPRQSMPVKSQIVKKKIKNPRLVNFIWLKLLKISLIDLKIIIYDDLNI